MEENPSKFEESLIGALPEPAAPIGFRSWAHNVRSEPLGFASSESSRLSAMEEDPSRFEEPATRTGFGSWAGRIRSKSLRFASSESSRLSAIEQSPSPFEEPLTGTLPGRLYEIEIR